MTRSKIGAKISCAFIGNVINRLRMWTVCNYMHRVSKRSIFSYVVLKMSTIWLAKDTVFLMRLAGIFPCDLRYTSNCQTYCLAANSRVVHVRTAHEYARTHTRQYQYGWTKSTNIKTFKCDGDGGGGEVVV